MAATIKIDGFDFYQYVRLAPGEGFDPASPGFQEPQFGETASNDSQPLISVNERNKEFAWPMHLKAASKNALHDLLIDVNRRLDLAQQVEWQDDGATEPTFYDVLYARFEPDYNYRRGQKNWLSGTLRIWVKPYGHTGTYKLIGSTMSPSWGFPVFLPATTALDGDAPARIRTSMAITNVGTSGAATAYSGISVLPTTAFGYFHAPSTWMWGSQSTPVPTLTAATNAIGSQAHTFWVSGDSWTRVITIETSPSQVMTHWTINDKSVAPGRNRVLAVMRALGSTSTGSGVGVYANDYDGNLMGATQVMAASCNWQLIDCGVLTQPTQVASHPVFQRVMVLAGRLGASSNTSTSAIQVNGVYIVPEESTFIGANRVSAKKRIVVNPEEHLDYVRLDGVDEVRRPVRAQFGVLPRLTPGSNPYKVMLFYQTMSGASMRQDQAYDTSVAHSLHVQERFTYAR